MIRTFPFYLAAFLSASLAWAADLPPDASTEIPQSAKRASVLIADAAVQKTWLSMLPKVDLPEGYEISITAAAPLVTHPTMGCLDDKGRMFVCDATGVNWNKAQLEANPPNRVLMLEDKDHDGVYDKSTVFADKMTFPQGACWLNGSLYVCAPPGLWKLTDRDGDGVAEKRTMIVSGFDYSGNAADVHGPFLNPTNGRLYWCHGRKGHKVIGKEGNVVHEGSACGIWSCKPDGSDVKWHSLGCGDNPVEVDFTPEGEIIGVQNLYFNKPRGDTVVHWLGGGVYEREDQLQAIAGLPRTLEHMPVMYNFGHVAVSGSAFWHAYPQPTKNGPLQFMVTHFNTQRVVRMELTPDGATYKARENEFLKMLDADIHLTDVMEDKDGSLLILNTGGWFRIGCPASLMAKPDIAGAIYRVKRVGTPAQPNSEQGATAVMPVASQTPASVMQVLQDLKDGDAHAQRRALESVAHLNVEDLERDDVVDTDFERLGEKLRQMMALPIDPVLEHTLIHAAQHLTFAAVTLEDLRATKDPITLRRMLVSFVPDDGAADNLCMEIASKNLDSSDAGLARTALWIVTNHADADEWVAPELMKWLSAAKVTSARLTALQAFCTALIAKPETQKVTTAMLEHATRAVRQTGLSIVANQTAAVANDAWLPPLERALANASAGDLPLLLDAIKKLKTPRFNERLQEIAQDNKQPLTLRLKALSAVKGLKLTVETFGLLNGVLIDPVSSSAARIQAATMLAMAALLPDQIDALATAFATVGPVELKELLPVMRGIKSMDQVRKVATELARNPVIGSQQESVYRTLLSAAPPEIFETIVLPAVRFANEASDAKKRQLIPLADKVVTMGDANAGRQVYESGRGSCIACHQIGDKGRAIGPNLSTIGAIRTERDLLESILFPSNTLARDYEAHVFELSDGQQTMAVIKSHTAEGLLVVDIAGQEKNLPHGQIVSDTTLPISLMPMGLDQTMPEQDLLNLVAFLRSLK